MGGTTAGGAGDPLVGGESLNQWQRARGTRARAGTWWRGPRHGAGGGHEVAINDVSADLLGVGVGDVIEAPTFSPADCETLLVGDQFPGFNGPLLRLEVVGRVLLADDLRGVAAESGPTGIGSPALSQRYDGEVCSTVIFASVRVGDDDPGIATIQATVDAAAVGTEKALVTSTEDDFEDVARSATEVVVVVLVLVGAAAAIAGIATGAQAVRRQVSVSAPAGVTLAALGMTRDQRARAIGAPIALAVVGGTIVGTVGAFVASAWFPVSFPRRIEPDPGLYIDLVTLVGGALFFALVGTAWAYVVARRVGGAVPGGRAARPSRAAEGAARAGLPPSAVIGLRLAYEGGPVTARVPVRSALAGASLAVLGVVAVVTLSATLHETTARPDRYGWTWSTMPDLEGDPEVAIEALGLEERIDAAARLAGGSVELAAGGAGPGPRHRRPDRCHRVHASCRTGAPSR